jgi:hypothetical protein
MLKALAEDMSRTSNKSFPYCYEMMSEFGLGGIIPWKDINNYIWLNLLANEPKTA